MNDFQKAKREIRLKDVLAHLGYHPQHGQEPDLWYISPLRPAENTPSFHICTRRNIWFDQGTGEGGSVIDFAVKFYQCGSGQALHKLRQLSSSPAPLLAQAPAVPNRAGEGETASSPIAIQKIKPFENPILARYLQSRGISYAIAQCYVQEAYYQHSGRQFFGVAFKNDAGGYELRSGGHAGNPSKAGFKGSVAPKDITTLHADKYQSGGPVAVFEGFTDFLSWLAHTDQRAPAMPVIVLNSSTMKDRGLAALRRMEAGTVYLYFDHDLTGRRLTESFTASLTGVAVQDASGVYDGFEDYNALVAASYRQARSR